MGERLIEGLSYEPLIDEAARWIVDEDYEVGYMPDANALAHYMDMTYGMTEEQVRAALAIAEERHQREIGVRD